VSTEFIDLTAEIVPLHVPLILGLHVMEKYGIRVCTSSQTLEGAGETAWSTPLKLGDGQLLLPWFPNTSGILFHKLELMRMHRGFHHPSSKRQYDILRRARPEEAPPHLLSTLEEIAHRCDTCQRAAHTPIQFKATTSRDLAFGEELELHLMWIEGNPVLHVTDVATRYSSAACLASGEIAVEFLKALTLCWTNFFPGFPRTMRCDSGPKFTSQRLMDPCAGVGVNLTLSVTTGRPLAINYYQNITYF
jgi:hypothetical protein